MLFVATFWRWNTLSSQIHSLYCSEVLFTSIFSEYHTQRSTLDSSSSLHLGSTSISQVAQLRRIGWDSWPRCFCSFDPDALSASRLCRSSRVDSWTGCDICGHCSMNIDFDARIRCFVCSRKLHQSWGG